MDSHSIPIFVDVHAMEKKELTEKESLITSYVAYLKHVNKVLITNVDNLLACCRASRR